MKTKPFPLAMAVLLALACAWFARLAWRAHRDLITLHVRNAPLAVVVRALERQSWEKIRFDSHLNARITLDMDNAPLSTVLDKLAEKAGALWGRTYAVYASDSALKGLESVLRGEEELAAAGWTNLAPKNEPLAPPPRGLPSSGEEKLPGMRQRHSIVVKGKRETKVISIGPDGVTHEWSSERLVLPAALYSRLGADLPSAATAETAARTASIVHGRSCLYYFLEPAPPGMDNLSGGGGTSSQAGAVKVGDIQGELTRKTQFRRLKELSLSPEAQVQQARQNLANQRQTQTLTTEETK